MPRIDPERLLRCLQPLLDTSNGSIRSNDEVDKILGLMSKFSKKLVSKCIYINILKSTHPQVLDLFMERGGWPLIFGWTNEGVTTKNYPLLKEVLELLLLTPTTVPRLKENRFPLLVKSLSKDCEVLELKNLAKQVVNKWIAVAKEEEAQLQQPMQQLPIVNTNNLGLVSSLPNNLLADHTGVPSDLGNLAMNSSDPLLNIDPTLIPDAENQLMDLDLSHTDLANIDFNLDILSKVVDQQNLDENLGGITSASTISQQQHIIPENQQQHHQQLMQTSMPPQPEVTSNLVLNTGILSHPPVTTMTMAPVVVEQQVQQIQPQPIPQAEEVYRMIPVQSAPKIYIKTVGGQPTVVQSLGSASGSYFMVIKDGKNVLMKLKEPSPTPLVIQSDNSTPEPGTVAVSQRSQDTPDSKESKKSTKKDVSTPPTIVKVKKPSGETTSLKTYSKKSPLTDKTIIKNHADQKNSKPHKDKEKDKDPQKVKPSSNEVPRKSKSSSSNSKAAQAAAAAKQQADDEKLREEIRKQKALVKKRAKEAEKKKELEMKDQETLKMLNLAPQKVASSPSASISKIPRIPRKQTSFADAIGIPGADGSTSSEKIKKVSPDKIKAEDVPSSPTKKTQGGKKDEPAEVADSEKSKERRHKPKVFVSSKSRADDLIDEMTKSGKPKSKDKDKKEEEKESKSSGGSGTGNSIPATPPLSKGSKRLSTDSVEKPVDSKKPKLDTSKEKDKSKEKEKKKPPTTAIKESSLFMDMLNAETTKPLSKRKRRPSTSGDKEKELVSPVEKSPRVNTVVKEEEDNAMPPVVQESGSVTPEEPVKKPVFNFYRDTLADSIDEEKNDESNKESDKDKEESEDMDQSTDSGSFTPQEGDGKIKSALCLHRSRNKPRKTVRWREDDELREYHYFEMDETERVNVTKQKEFTELSQHERQNERYFMRRKAEEETEKETGTPWRMRKIDFPGDPINATVTSQERFIQEERERNVLGLFLPPGAPLPDTPLEPDAADAIATADDIRIIPVDDVNNVSSKVVDYTTTAWPMPKLGLGGTGGFGMPEMEVPRVNPVLNSFPPAAANDFNPWSASLGFTVPPPSVPVPNMSELPFSQFSIPPPSAMGLMAGQPPPVPMPFSTPNPFAFPPAMMPPMNGPLPNAVDAFGGNQMGRGSRFGDSDQRRNYHGRDRDSNFRDRGGNGRDRDFGRDDRGRDYRRRDRDGNDRDYNNRHFDSRDRNQRDFRGGSGRNIRKDIPCKFFKKGYCHLGSRCEFLHDNSNSLDSDSRTSRQDTHDSGRSRDRDSSTKDVDLRPSSSFEKDEDWESPAEPTPLVNNELNATRFAQPPSSPTEPEIAPFTTNSESTKVIPV